MIKKKYILILIILLISQFLYSITKTCVCLVDKLDIKMYPENIGNNSSFINKNDIFYINVKNNNNWYFVQIDKYKENMYVAGYIFLENLNYIKIFDSFQEALKFKIKNENNFDNFQKIINKLNYDFIYQSGVTLFNKRIWFDDKNFLFFMENDNQPSQIYSILGFDINIKDNYYIFYCNQEPGTIVINLHLTFKDDDTIIIWDKDVNNKAIYYKKNKEKIIK